MSEDRSNNPSGQSGNGSQNNSGEPDQNRVRRRKKKKKSKGVSPEISNRVTTIILILLGVLFVFSLYYIVVNMNVKTTR